MLIHELYHEALKRTPDKIAFCCNDLPCTYREMARTVDLYARALVGLGIRKGDRIALLMQNINEISWLYLACSRAGAIAVPLSCYSKPPDIAYALNHCSARLLFASQALLHMTDDAVSAIPSLERILVVNMPDASPGDTWRQAVTNAPAHVDWPDIEPADPAIIIYTSGSTDKPKGVTHTQRSLVHCALNRAKGLSLKSSDVYLNTGYLCHGAALTTTFLPMIHVGGTAVFPVSFTPALGLTMIQHYRPTFAAAGPSQLLNMIEHPSLKETALDSLAYFTSGGDVVPASLHQRFLEIFGFPLSESIGMTECSTYMTTPPGMRHNPGSMGKPIFGVQVRLVNEAGADVPPGEPGEILVRTETMMSGYWNDPVNTSNALVDGWLHTGDLARQDPDGYYFFVGRIKNMIVRESCNISPGEVENLINTHPKVKRSGIIGVPDERRGQRVIAFVVPDPSQPAPTPGELRAFLAKRLPDPRIPDQWVLVDSLPYTPSGKLDRRALQEIALKRQA